jgi:tRNA(Ile)-lysidine synthase
MGPSPAVATVRSAVRDALPGLEPGGLVLAACSGGADSLALAAALAFVAPRLGLRAGGVTVDHGLQPGSAQRAERVASVLAGLGLRPAEHVAVSVTGTGGPEAAARAARYAALDAVADRAGASAVLLGHTLDDQAETVLLGLARGSGARSLAGMPATAGRYRRPLLGVSRSATRKACAALGLQPWDDPHNQDPAFARVRVRHQALPALESALGPGVTEALARTARLLRADAEALDAWAAAAAERLTRGTARPGAGRDTGRGGGGADTGAGIDAGIDAQALAALPAAVRTRVLHRAAAAGGCPPGALTARHVAEMDALVTRWHGQRWIELPGGVRAVRRHGKLLLERPGQGRDPAGSPARGGPGEVVAG